MSAATLSTSKTGVVAVAATGWHSCPNEWPFPETIGDQWQPLEVYVH